MCSATCTARAGRWLWSTSSAASSPSWPPSPGGSRWAPRESRRWCRSSSSEQLCQSTTGGAAVSSSVLHSKCAILPGLPPALVQGQAEKHLLAQPVSRIVNVSLFAASVGGGSGGAANTNRAQTVVASNASVAWYVTEQGPAAWRSRAHANMSPPAPLVGPLCRLATSSSSSHS